MTAADACARLAEITANLGAYIERRADEIAAPRIAAEQQRADDGIREVRGGLEFELQRQTDLVHELRRHLKVAERQALAGRLDEIRYVMRAMPHEHLPTCPKKFGCCCPIGPVMRWVGDRAEHLAKEKAASTPDTTKEIDHDHH